MFTTPDIIIATVNKFVSDEIHIIGKQSKTPEAILTFIPVDGNGDKITIAPIATISLKGEAFNYWYENWNGETTLYSSLLNCLKLDKKGFTLTGVDITKLSSIDNLKVEQSEEVLAIIS